MVKVLERIIIIKSDEALARSEGGTGVFMGLDGARHFAGSERGTGQCKGLNGAREIAAIRLLLGAVERRLLQGGLEIFGVKGGVGLGAGDELAVAVGGRRPGAVVYGEGAAVYRGRLARAFGVFGGITGETDCALISIAKMTRTGRIISPLVTSPSSSESSRRSSWRSSLMLAPTPLSLAP